MRWYHWIAAYLIILSGLVLGALPDTLKTGWVVTGLVAGITLGVVMIKYLPNDETEEKKRGKG